MTTPKAFDTLAAIDLGSNSFHMLIAQLNGYGGLEKIDSMRESIRLGQGLTRKKMISEEAQNRALKCLIRFQHRIAQLPVGSVRIAGTNTLRRAKNAQEFIDKAEQILGHPIEIISGREEARLIYLGVANGQESLSGKRLVIDIGGGSTELILGEENELEITESLVLGCVSLSLKYFPDGSLSAHQMEEAITHAKLSILPVFQPIIQNGWTHALGCSGTIKAIRRIVQKQQWCKTGITLPALYKLRDEMLQFEHVNELSFASLKEERRPVLPGGLAILIALFEMFGIQHMEVSKQALREGLLYDLLGRIEHKDIRNQTIASLMERWQVDPKQAHSVAEMTQLLLPQVKHEWNLQEPRFASFLRWAALVHELGLRISHRRYHQHSAYVLSNADLPGFSFQEQQFLSVLVINHRRKFKFLHSDRLPDTLFDSARYLCVLLRIAVLLCRKRTGEIPPFIVNAEEDYIELVFPDGWLEQHPLLEADLDKESQNLEYEDIELVIRSFVPEP